MVQDADASFVSRADYYREESELFCYTRGKFDHEVSFKVEINLSIILNTEGCYSISDHKKYSVFLVSESNNRRLLQYNLKMALLAIAPVIQIKMKIHQNQYIIQCKLQVPERIRAMNASVKLLLIVREPVTRAISDYAQLRANAATASPVVPPSASKSFEQLVLHPNGSINEAYRPLSISVYHHYLHRWLEVFPREQILVVNGDLLIEDPVSQIQKIESFLGLEPRIGTHNFYFNETKGFYCLRNETSDRCLKETKGRKHPRVNPRVLSKLRKYFGEHNQKFYELIGEELGWPEE